MKTKPKKIKQSFKSEDEERAFWAHHSPIDVFDASKARQASFPNLKPSLQSISIRLPKPMLDELKILANRRDVAYQHLAKIYLSWGIQADRNALHIQANHTLQAHAP